MIALLMMGVSAPAMAANYDVNTQITDVTVHQGVASITRHGTINLPAGKHVLTLKNLPEDMSLMPFQLSANGQSLGKVTATRVSNSHDMDSRRKALEAQLQNLESNKQALLDQIDTAHIQIDMLKNMGQLNGTGLMMSATSDPAKWQASLDAMSKGAAKAFRTIREVKTKLPALEREIETVESNINHLGREERITSSLTAEIVVDANTTLPLTLHYLVSGASWDVAHEVHANSKKGEIKIRPKADVKQSTGEDWAGVKLTLSTSQPMTSSHFVGELPHYLANLEDPRELPMKQFRMERRAKASYAPMEAIADMEAPPTRTRTVKSELALSYVWNAPYSLKSGGEADTIDLAASTYKSDIYARATPEFSTDVFLVGRVEISDEPMLDGVSNVYLDGAYVGDFSLGETHAGGTALIPLGADRQITLKRVVEKSKEGDSGLFGSKQRDEARYRYDITNNHAKDIMVEVLDAWPTALHEDIKVEALKSGTKITQEHVRDTPGHMMWSTKIKSGKTAVIRNHYSVTYPADKRLDIDSR